MPRLMTVIVLFAVSCSTAWAGGIALTMSDSRHQLEIGGPAVGAEFHRGRALPSRISWYLPVANSMDVSADYWTRGGTLVMTAVLDGDSLGLVTDSVTWQPNRARFFLGGPGGEALWRFADSAAVALLQLTPSPAWVGRTLVLRAVAQLRTSHSYRSVDPTAMGTAPGVAWAEFFKVDTDSAVIALGLAGPEGVRPRAEAAVDEGGGLRWLELRVEVQDTLPLLFLLSSSHRAESLPAGVLTAEEAKGAADRWDEQVLHAANAATVSGWHDSRIAHGVRWAGALAAVDRHPLHGSPMPMPCPAQYNFFFTHDMLVNHLGTVRFDTETVGRDLRTMLTLASGSSTLPHAHYWRDGEYVTEWCGPENWNHLWFLMLAGAFARHGGDVETLAALAPMLEASMSAVAGHIDADTLMVAGSPDWWDIGDAEGARSYLSALASRALVEGVEARRRAGLSDTTALELLRTSSTLRRSIVQLWDDSTGYLHDRIGEQRDPHYYSGALVAAWTRALSASRARTLVATAERVLLDPAIGLRNVMPADFHLLTERYRFLEGEVGGAYLYINGGVWPQGNAWLALAQAEQGRAGDARETLARYLTPLGVADSPGGQPSVYEYRNADRTSPGFGRVDKPTFLWAGGWLLHGASRVAGLVDGPFNLRLDPAMPEGEVRLRLHLARPGGTTVVTRTGDGASFGPIVADGAPFPSAVIVGGFEEITAEAGLPSRPTLIEAEAEVVAVEGSEDRLMVRLAVTPGQSVGLRVHAPGDPGSVRLSRGEARVSSRAGEGFRETRVSFRAEADTVEVRFAY